MGAFDHPAACPLPLTSRAQFLAMLPHMRRIAALPHDQSCRCTRIALVRTEVMSAPAGDLGAHDDDGVECGLQHVDVMPVVSADDKGQRDANSAHQ